MVPNFAFATDTVYNEAGNLTYYYDDYNINTKMTIPTVDKDNAVEIAKDFINRFAEEVKAHINTQVYTITFNKTSPYGYIITFPRIINNIIYDIDNVSLFIDSKNGKVVSYSKNFGTHTLVEGDGNIITLEEAREKYITAMGIKLQYNKKIEGDKIIPYLVYTADNILINANSGNIIPSPYFIPGDGYFDIVNTAQKVSEYVDNQDVISISRADEFVREIKELNVAEEYSIASVDYLKNYDDTYLISLLYKNGLNTKEVTLNAKNGVLVEYNDNSFHTNQYKTTSPEEFLNTYYKDYANTVIKRKSTTSNQSVFLYERLVYDIPYKSNGIYACFDDGKLTKLSFAWDNVEFPSAQEVISPKYIYQQFFKKTGLDLTYHKRENGALVPVYKNASSGTGIYDAFSGKQLNYDGSPYYSAKELSYLDANTHYSGYAAKALSSCDIYVSSGNVYLEDNISQQEFLLLLTEFINGTKPIINTTGVLTPDQREMLYAYMYEHNILKRSETDYMSFVTRADAVKYFLRILGYGTVGDMSDIYIPHFVDWEQIPKDAIGYVELARALKIINGSYGNKFNPNEYITNGDSLIIVYNYLKTQE